MLRQGAVYSRLTNILFIIYEILPARCGDRISMKRLKKFVYFEATSVKEAVEILSEKDGAFPLAGGTDLLVRMKRGEIRPATLVNLKHIQDLKRIKSGSGKGTTIGALASISDIQCSPVVRAKHPLLIQAAGVLGVPSIRNLATIGGNIGRASPASDMSPSLMILQARIMTAGPKGEREVGLNEILAGPGITTLAKGEIITAFFIPEPAPGTGTAYLKLGRRAGGADCALVGVATLLTVENNEVQSVGIALSSVGPKPIRALKAEQVVMSGPLGEERIKEAARAAADEVNPITDLRCSASYRKEMVKVLTYRALTESLQKAQGGKPA
jgi:carbon-monoxide dehydrogenase medium subunit